MTDTQMECGYSQLSAKENPVLLQQCDTCDKYDYLAAVTCGVIGGMVDIFLVGAPTDSVLGAWSDAQIDNAVMAFAKKAGWSPRAENTHNVGSAIGFLERKFSVNYDQKNTSDAGGLFQMGTKNHHMKSLSHSPDPIGLFFSILNQFTSTSTFLTNGQVITIQSDAFELRGSSFVAKIFCGFTNWLGHIMSDIAGSSGSRGNVGRGTGVALPFYELFGLCNFGQFQVGRVRQDLATIATRTFQEGYDLRFGLATAIPVVITDLSIRVIWSIRRHFQYKRPLPDCLPTQEHADLRVMLLFGTGTLCVIDGVDAAIRSGGNYLALFMRLNLIAWMRFVLIVLKEICIRAGIMGALQMNIEAYKRINAALQLYLSELEQLDIQRFVEEADQYNRTVKAFAVPLSEPQLNAILLNSFQTLNLDVPWTGDFDAFMKQKTEHLEFK